MNPRATSAFLPVLLLAGSNVFMTFAWYGHLKHKSAPLWLVIMASWGIAFFEYLLMVPANRLGSNFYSVTQLKMALHIQQSCNFNLYPFPTSRFRGFQVLVSMLRITKKIYQSIPTTPLHCFPRSRWHR